MDYENKYKEALEAIKKLQEANPNDEGIQNWVNDNFPELKESEDERIRKEIIEYIKTGTYHKDWIAWLEKQDNKPVNIDIESMVSSYKQRLESQGNGSMKNNPLVNMCLTAFKHGVEEVLQELNLKEFEKPQGESEIERIRKAAKAIKEEKVDNANKSVSDFKASDYYVSKVDGKIHNVHNFNELKKIEQNPAWSEEDDYNVQCLAAKVTSDIQNGNVGRNQELIDWLKSIKGRVQPQNMWKPSEEQIKALEHFVRGIGESGYISPYDANIKLVHSLLNDLKKLK